MESYICALVWSRKLAADQTMVRQLTPRLAGWVSSTATAHLLVNRVGVKMIVCVPTAAFVSLRLEREPLPVTV